MTPYDYMGCSGQGEHSRESTHTGQGQEHPNSQGKEGVCQVAGQLITHQLSVVKTANGNNASLFYIAILVLQEKCLDP